MKVCSRCKAEKETDYFHKKKSAKDGLHGFCKVCVSKDVAEYRAKNKDKIRARYHDNIKESRARYRAYNSKYKDRNKRWRENNRDKTRGYANEYYRLNSEKKKAHTSVITALSNGSLVKENCSKCGSWKNINAHHVDYSKPLKVVWLCRKCHCLEHRK